MSLNRHNPFVAALSTLVEPTPAVPAAATRAIGARTSDHLTFRERLDSWTAQGEVFGAAADGSSAELPVVATSETSVRKQ